MKRKIYTLSADLTPEVKAVTFAKCSRSPESFQDIANELTEEKSSQFHEKWVVGYGHSSVAEHAVISLAVENVSILATKVIEDARLASFTEKSTRYQVFTKDSLYRPNNLGDLYNETVDYLMNTYQEMTEPMEKFIKEKYPQKDESDSLYKMISRSRACDNIRYLLPTATLTNLGLTINARNLEHLIKKLLSHNLPEMRDIGEEIKREALKEVPTLVRFAEANPYTIETKEALKKIVEDNNLTGAGNNEAVQLIDYDKEAENKLVSALLYSQSQLSFQEITKQVQAMSEEKKDDIINESLKRRATYDAPLRELEHVYYTFDILIDYGAFRDIQRHRMCTQTNQEVTVIHGYDMPPEIAEAGLEEKFRSATEKAMDAFITISKDHPYEAQYLVPLCFRKRVLFTWNLRELFHFISLRSGKKGHPSYRRIAQECWRQLNKVHPRLAKYIKVDMEEMSASWAATLENKDYYYNPWAARTNNGN
jgi:thymidylate synthase ThyX